MTDFTAMERASYPSRQRAINKTVFCQNYTLTNTAGRQLDSQLCVKFTLQANPGNSGTMYVGTSNVSTSTHMAALNPGNSMDFSVYNTNLLYIRGTSADKIAVGGEY